MRKTCKRKPRQGGFFLLPNEIFTLGLSAGEIAVYAYLLFCEDRETHLCYPSFRKIGEHTGMSPNTVRKYITQLEDKYLIETLPTTVWTLDGTARNGTYDPSHSRGGELSPGAATSGITDEKRWEKKTVKTKLGPVRACVRFCEPGRGTTPARPQTGAVGGV